MTSTTWRWRALSTRSAGPASRRSHRSTWWRTTAAAGCFSPWAWWPRSTRRDESGTGQVVDAAMVDGVAQLTALFHGGLAEGGGARRGSRTSSTAPHLSTTPTSHSDGESLRLGPSSRSSSPCSSSGSGSIRAALPAQYDRDEVARVAPASRRGDLHPHQGPMGGGTGGDRLLRRRGALAGRGASPSAQRGSGDLHRGRRGGPTCPSAPVLGHTDRHCLRRRRHPARTPTPSSPSSDTQEMRSVTSADPGLSAEP